MTEKVTLFLVTPHRSWRIGVFKDRIQSTEGPVADFFEFAKIFLNPPSELEAQLARCRMLVNTTLLQVPVLVYHHEKILFHALATENLVVT